jgi:hypothetical protein
LAVSRILLVTTFIELVDLTDKKHRNHTNGNQKKKTEEIMNFFSKKRAYFINSLLSLKVAEGF